MKKLTSIFLSLVFLLSSPISAFAANTQKDTVNDDYVKKEFNGISFEYNDTYDLSDDEDTIVITFDPTASITIIGSDTSSFSKELAAIIPDTMLDNMISSMKAAGAKIQSLEKADCDISNITAKCATFVASANGQAVNVGITCFSKNSICYSLIFVNNATAGNYVEEYVVLLESIEFIKTAEKPASSQPSSQQSTPSKTVYWVANGKSYHFSKDCATLKRSTNIKSGTISESGKSDPCNICAGG